MSDRRDDLAELFRRDLERMDLPPASAWLPAEHNATTRRWSSLLVVPMTVGAVALALVVAIVISLARGELPAAKPGISSGSPSASPSVIESPSAVASATPSASPGAKSDAVKVNQLLPRSGQFAIVLTRHLDQSPTAPNQAAGSPRLPATDSIEAVPLTARATTPRDTLELVSFTGGVDGAPLATNYLREQFSPDGHRLVLSAILDRGAKPRLGLVVVDLTTGDVRELTTDARYHDEMPAWSPTSDRIAFTRTTVGGATARDAGIWTISADGTGLRQVLAGADAGPGVELDSWNGDGSGIAYTTGFGLGTYHVLDVASGRTSQLGSYHGQSGRGSSDWRQASPAFVGGFSESANGGAPYVIVGKDQLASSPYIFSRGSTANTTFGSARWRPSGADDFLYVSTVVDPNPPTVGGTPAAPQTVRRIYTGNAQGVINPDRRVVKEVTYSSLFAAWSPDGRDVVYLEGLGVGGSLHLIDPSGVNDRVVQVWGGIPELDKTWLDLAVLSL